MNSDKNLINKIFQEHYQFHMGIGVDFVKSDSGHINQVSSDYQGRVLYELLQNAFDRAESKILVKVIGQSLYVANDGKKFTYNSDHDYKDGGIDGKKFERSDFHSLCSISTSNKTVSESIGNKGVGFKSVYALGRYANIHTKGIVNPSSSKEDACLSFRLYDVFDDANNLPSEFDEDLEVKKHLEKTIKSIQREFPHRGIPGYYFPLLLNTEKLDVFNQFDNDFVTIVEVPFSEIDKVKQLFEEIKNIHFQFVRLKYPNKNFEITFDFDGVIEIQKVENNKNKFFFAVVENVEIFNLAKAAGITITEPKVAIYLKDTPEGKLYNYLPTKVPSPFKYVDFHADFHTKVDRTYINFEENTAIGKYNSALLRACVELFFNTINNYLDSEKQIELTLKYIKSISHIENELLFHSNLLEYHRLDDIKDILFRIVQDTLQISNYRYEKSVKLFAEIAKKHFDNHNDDQIEFINHTLNFINEFSTTYVSNFQPESEKKNDHKLKYANKLREIKAKIIPNVQLSDSTELLFRKNSENEISLPDFLGINITDFEISDKFFKEKLGINDFTEYNELLKYYKQCSYNGDINNDTLLEIEQKELLKSCYHLYLKKNKSKDYCLSTHRYTNAYNATLRERNRPINQANFGVSTLFLKLKNAKYKPAQLCVKSELDLTFISFCDTFDLDNWLRFMGVSTESEYRFVDIKIHNALKDGVTEIPLLQYRKKTEDITGDLISNIRIITPQNISIHPSVINDNNYSFLKNISNRKIKPELDNLLVKDYSKFPIEYLNSLKARLDEYLHTRKNDVLQFYQNIFEVYSQEKLYLVIQNNKLKWVQGSEFYVLGNKSDFDLCIKNFPSHSILGYYLGRSESLKDRIIHPTKGEILFSDKNTNYIVKKELSEKLVYILLNLSHSKNSESNYLSEDADLSTIQAKFENMMVYDCSTLSQELKYDTLGTDVSAKSYAFNGTELYLSNVATKSQVTQGICDYLFGNISIKDQVELILWHKGQEQLKQESDRAELDVINRKWKSDYTEKYNSFQKTILDNYDILPEHYDQWYRYSKEHQNEFLIELDRNGKLNELERRIALTKSDFEGYFDFFQLEIDYSHINSDITIIKVYSENTDLDIIFSKKIQQLIEKASQMKLGIEDEIEQIKNEVPEIFNLYNSNTNELEKRKQELEDIQTVESIFSKVKFGIIKEVGNHLLDTSNLESQELERKHKQIIFQSNSDMSVKNTQMEITGASGEIEVLICLINEFIQMSLEDRKKGIEAIKIEMKRHTKNNEFDKFSIECESVVNDDDKLSKALIPLLYVAKKYKYAYFDLIGYRNGKPTLIEVKTTKSINNKNFYLSIAEVNTARNYQDYEIVRVTPKSIVFMGNPIKTIDQNLLEIKTNGFMLKPRNYEFILNN